MANSFVGQTVLVILKGPDGRAVEGVVAEVHPATKTLILHNAAFRDSGHRFDVWTAVGSQIEDIKFLSLPEQSTAAQKSLPSDEMPAASEVTLNKPRVDPAILAFRRPKNLLQGPDQSGNTYEAPNTPAKTSYQTAIASLPKISNSPFIGGPEASVNISNQSRMGRAGPERGNPAAPVPVPVINVSRGHVAGTQDGWSDLDAARNFGEMKRTQKTEAGEAGRQNDVETAKGNLKVRPRKGRGPTGASRRKRLEDFDENGGGDEADRDTAGQVEKETGRAVYRGKGWRKTPFLQEGRDTGSDISPKVPKAKASGLGQAKGKTRKNERAVAGWAMEEAAGIQEMGDYDFVKENSKFDKSRIFAEFRNETDQEQSNHAKQSTAHRPGTFGGKNLHPSEKVIDTKGPRGSRSHRNSKIAASVESPDSSTSSPTFNNFSLLPSVLPGPRPLLLRTGSMPLRKTSFNSHHTRPASSASTNPNRFTPPDSPLRTQTHDQRFNVELWLKNRDVPCPTISPGSMTALEELTENEFSISAETVNENAGRGLAEIILQILESLIAHRSLMGDPRPPHVMFLVGNHRAGARALVAARHLRARGVLCAASVLGLDRPSPELELIPEVLLQANRVFACGASVASWSSIKDTLLKSDSDDTDVVDLWIDALLTPGRTYDTLVPEDQVAVWEMVQHLNIIPPGWQRRLVISVDMPCGLDASTGASTLIDGQKAFRLRSKYVVCMGAPRVGLVRAMKRLPDLLAIQLWVADIGINLAWKKFGKSRRLVLGKGVDFERNWTVPLRVAYEKASTEHDLYGGVEVAGAQAEAEERSEGEDYGVDDQ